MSVNSSAEGETGRNLRRARSEDVGAIVERYGIPEFVYHTWRSAPENAPSTSKEGARPDRSSLMTGTADVRSMGGGRPAASSVGLAGGSPAPTARPHAPPNVPVPWTEPEDLRSGLLPIFASLLDPAPLIVRLTRTRNRPAASTVSSESDPARAARLRPLTTLPDADEFDLAEDISAQTLQGRLFAPGSLRSTDGGANGTGMPTGASGSSRARAADPLVRVSSLEPLEQRSEAEPTQVLSVVMHASHPLSRAEDPDPVYPALPKERTPEELLPRRNQVEDPYALLNEDIDVAHLERTVVSSSGPSHSADSRGDASVGARRTARSTRGPQARVAKASRAAPADPVVAAPPGPADSPSSGVPAAGAPARDRLRRLLLKGDRDA